MSKSTTAYIGLGSNLGDRESYIKDAIKMLSAVNKVEVNRISDSVETAPLGGKNQPPYLNAVAEITTILNAEDLHRQLIIIENSLGRGQHEKWSPRIIDLDLLLFGQDVINLPSLTVPHPQMHLRSFVLKGLCQLNDELLHPIIKESMHDLADRLGGADFILNSNLPQLVSIAGIIGVGKTTLVKKLSEMLDCVSLFEAYDTNPFMPDVYAGKNELALDSQLYFLTSRISQLNHSALLAGQLAVSDYVFDKELIYAKRLLNNRQLALYNQIHQQIANEASSPMLVIYLTDTDQNCLSRIQKRNRSYEQKIDLKFLKELSSDYEQLFCDWKRCPVIRINLSNFDCTKETNTNLLARQIKFYITTQP